MAAHHACSWSKRNRIDCLLLKGHFCPARRRLFGTGLVAADPAFTKFGFAYFAGKGGGTPTKSNGGQDAIASCYRKVGIKYAWSSTGASSASIDGVSTLTEGAHAAVDDTGVDHPLVEGVRACTCRAKTPNTWGWASDSVSVALPIERSRVACTRFARRAPVHLRGSPTPLHCAPRVSPSGAHAVRAWCSEPRSLSLVRSTPLHSTRLAERGTRGASVVWQAPLTFFGTLHSTPLRAFH